MNSKSVSQAQLAAPSGKEHEDQPVQTGALSGGQPGQAVNTSSSPRGQSYVDASLQQGTEYGKKDRDQRLGQ